jgi:transposase
VRLHLFVAVLGYSRRLYVRASLSQRQDDWREELAGAFSHFAGVPQTLLLVVGHTPAATHTAARGLRGILPRLGVQPRVCHPYRARNKGKTE